MPLESLRRLFCRVKLYLAVIFLQFGYAGMSIIAKYALDQGMSHFVFIAYRMAIASVVITPFAIVLERTSRPRMTLSIFVKAMLLSFFDPLLDQNLLFIGMTYTNASFTSAMCNTIPAFAFSMAWVFGLEQVNTRRLHSKAKIIGTLVAVGGAMFMTLFKGSVINPPWTNGRNPHDHPSARPASKENVMKGALLVLGSCFFWSCFMILHGVISTAITYYIQGVILKDRGPIFVTAFRPLTMVIVAIMATFMLNENMFLGRVIGAVVIVVGLYLVLWGKSKEQKLTKSDSDEVLPNAHTTTSLMNESITTSNPRICVHVDEGTNTKPVTLTIIEPNVTV
ncbi:WAT1-related protein At2g39510-like [Corylus avellana]|uniref:WAT1-related protein At2g39510-like n=1 Tax=Corylus avellana TaxID=13451 RepID=UPI00286B42B9|nr:WAT1-related protein At2g39510-like [Corylus avellana]